MELFNHVVFNLDNLTASYRQFFDKQKQETYHGIISANDSLYINVLFEKAVNDITRMFIEFKRDKSYKTNSFDKQGEITEKTETGTYTFNFDKKEIRMKSAERNHTVSRYKVIFIDNNKLVIKPANSRISAILTCSKVVK